MLGISMHLCIDNYLNKLQKTMRLIRDTPKHKLIARID